MRPPAPVGIMVGLMPRRSRTARASPAARARPPLARAAAQRGRSAGGGGPHGRWACGRKDETGPVSGAHDLRRPGLELRAGDPQEAAEGGYPALGFLLRHLALLPAELCRLECDWLG